MTRVPMFASNRLAIETGIPQSANPPMRPAMRERYPNIVSSRFDGAERMAVKYALDREALDVFAFESHQRAIRATEQGAFDNEILAAADDVRGRWNGQRDDRRTTVDIGRSTTRFRRSRRPPPDRTPDDRWIQARAGSLVGYERTCSA